MQNPKTQQTTYCLQKTQFRYKDSESKLMEKNIPCKHNDQKKGEIVCQYKIKQTLRQKNVTKEKGHYIMVRVNPSKTCNNYKYVCT